MKIQKLSPAVSTALAALLALAGCSQATSLKSADEAPKFTPVSLDFEDGKPVFEKDYGADPTVVTDAGSNATKVLSVTSTGNYEGWEYTFANPVNLTTARTLALSLNAPSSDGTVLALLDAKGNGYGFWIGGSGAWVTTTLKLSKTGIVDESTDPVTTGWSWTSTAGDMTKITKLRITANERAETILVDNLTVN